MAVPLGNIGMAVFNPRGLKRLTLYRREALKRLEDSGLVYRSEPSYVVGGRHKELVGGIILYHDAFYIQIEVDGCNVYLDGSPPTVIEHQAKTLDEAVEVVLAHYGLSSPSP